MRKTATSATIYLKYCVSNTQRWHIVSIKLHLNTPGRKKYRFRPATHPTKNTLQNIMIYIYVYIITTTLNIRWVIKQQHFRKSVLKSTTPVTIYPPVKQLFLFRFLNTCSCNQVLGRCSTILLYDVIKITSSQKHFLRVCFLNHVSAIDFLTLFSGSCFSKAVANTFRGNFVYPGN